MPVQDSPSVSNNKSATMNGGAVSPTGSEHQYDIPFSHLTPGGVRAAAAKNAAAAAAVAAASASSTPQTRYGIRTFLWY